MPKFKIVANITVHDTYEVKAKTIEDAIAKVLHYEGDNSTIAMTEVGDFPEFDCIGSVEEKVGKKWIQLDIDQWENHA